MTRTVIKTLYTATPADRSEITVCGWVRSIRAGKNFSFMELSDGSCLKGIQIVIDESAENYREISKLNVGSAVVAEGTLILTPEAKQPFEMHSVHITAEGIAPSDYPLQKKRHTLEYLRTISHLRARTNAIGSVMRVRSAAAFAIHSFFNERNFIYVNTPIITASDCEGAGEMFRVTSLDIADPPKNKDGTIDFSQDFFGRPASLTVSGQLEGEAMAMALGNVYTFGPTFRAENSNTPRHAAEFWMIEPEMAFSDLNDDMELAKDMIKYVLKYVLENCPQEMQLFNDFYDKELIARIKNLIDADFAKVTYTEAIEILEKHKDEADFKYPVYWGADLQTEHERFLTEKIYKKPLFVTDYPKEIKAFYMRLNDDGKTVAAMDLLVPGVGEIIGGSQREERLDALEKRMEELKLDKSAYEWYLDLRRFGGTKHAGFGLGFERLIMYITGIQNIRDAIPFPRTAGNAEY